MTNPTLERAARAACDAFNEPDTWDQLPERYREKYRRQARAVLMAVLPELKRLDTDECPGVYRSDDGEYVRYDDLTAILAEGE